MTRRLPGSSALFESQPRARKAHRFSTPKEASLGHLFLDTEVDAARKLNDFNPKLVEAVGIESTGNHRKPDPELPESKHEEKLFRETVLPCGKTEAESRQGRADVGDMPTAETLGALARKVLSSSRHTDSRRLARAVLRLLARQ
jgi:hypothetical protein